MAEQFLTLMADLDDNSQELMSGWYKELQDAGFTGVQTPGLPFHISLATFSLNDEGKAIEEMHRLAEEFTSVPVHFSHIGMFAGGKVLFCAPDMNPPELLKLHDAIKINTIDEPRKYYGITEKGRAQLAEMDAAWQEMVESIDALKK